MRRFAATLIEDLICLIPHKPASVAPVVRGSWHAPESGWIKVNMDASFIMAIQSGSGGVVIRNDHGELLQATANHYEHVPDVLTAEALAARDGLLLARACGFMKVVLEGDNISLVNLLRSEAGIRSPIVGLWHEIVDIGRSFTSFCVSFVNREGNEATHFCAKLASNSSQVGVWSDSFPTGIGEIALNDCKPVAE
jgi:hypothetical protein